MAVEDSEKTITLREAYDRWRRETGISNAYDWYRRNAQSGGRVFDQSSGVEGSARKVGNTWMIAERELEEALDARRVREDEINRATADYANHILHGEPGQTVEMRGGFYRVFYGIHVRTVCSPDPAWDGIQTWRCSICWKHAATEHNNPECHLCSDWGGCGRDCTFSRAFCLDCRTSYPPMAGTVST